ncbi:MAG: SDR family oxidoreductase [Dermatophilaceae bacterium]
MKEEREAHEVSTPDSEADTTFSNQRRSLVKGMAGGLAVAGTGLLSLGTAQTAMAAAPGATKPLAGKVAIVTGARNNFGRAFAVALARGGANVVVHYHRRETVKEAQETARLVEAEGAKVELVAGDLGKTRNVRTMFDTAVNKLGRVDILISNAGKIVKRPIAEITDDEFDQLMNVNTRAHFLCAREAARRMEDDGRILFMGTSLLAGNAPGYSAYAGTKAAVEEFTRMVAREIGSRGITVNTINPGPFNTPFFFAAETPESAEFAANLSVAGRLGEIPELVPLIEFLASPSAQWISGQSVWINGAYITR